MKRAAYLLSVLLVVVFAAAPALAQINWVEHVVHPMCLTPKAANAWDVNGDGDTDILGGPGTEVILYDNNGYQAFRQIQVAPFISGGAYAMEAADFDNDGDNDVVVAAYSEDHLGWYEYDATAGFTYHFLGFFNACMSVDVADIDNDTDLDVVAASATGDKVSAFINDGSQNFTELVLEDTLDQARYVYCIDMDYDGDLDVVCALYTPDVVYWLENDTAWVRHDVGPLDGAYCCKAADFDNDNDIDIVACGYMSQTVEIFRNDGNMVFTSDTIAPAVGRPRNLDVGDVDNDGDIDVVVTGYSDGMVLVYINNGATFAETIACDNMAYCYQVNFADVDTDGDLDIVTAGYYGYKISWIESDVTGAFPLEITMTPHDTVINIPAGGGSFGYDVSINNTSLTETYVIDTWIDITLPPGQIYPILSRGNLTVPPGGTMLRTLTQYIPGTAMPGVYSYNGHARDHSTWQVYFNDCFPFTKLEGTDAANHNHGWALFGWDDEAPAGSAPADYALNRAYPNPFNPSTYLTFDLPQAGEVTLAVYNIRGEEVARLVDGWYSAGSHGITFDAAALSSGVYFAKITAGSFTQTQKLLLTK